MATRLSLSHSEVFAVQREDVSERYIYLLFVHLFARNCQWQANGSANANSR